MLSILNSISFDTSKIDENAITVFVIGFSVVFGALISIYLFFQFLPMLITLNSKEKKAAKKEKQKQKTIQVETKEDNSEVFAAIAMALHMHFEDMHDEESLVLTMDIKDRANTQWGAKNSIVN